MGIMKNIDIDGNNLVWQYLTSGEAHVGAAQVPNIHEQLRHIHSSLNSSQFESKKMAVNPHTIYSLMGIVVWCRNSLH